MNNNKDDKLAKQLEKLQAQLEKKQAQLEKTNNKLKEVKNNIDKNFGHTIIKELDLEYSKLDKETINNLSKKIAKLYKQNSEHYE